MGDTNRPRIGRKQEQLIRVRLAAGDGILRVAREEGVGTGTVWRDQARDGCCVVVMKARDPEAARQWMADFDARVLPIARSSLNYATKE